MKIRVLGEHRPSETYHEWVFGGLVRADILGRRNPRMHEANWMHMHCNNGACAGEAFVSMALVASAIEVELERRMDERVQGNPSVSPLW